MQKPINDIRENGFPSANPIPFRHVMALISEGVAVLSLGRVIFANAALCEMTGKNRGEIIGCSFLELVADADRTMVSDYLRQIDVPAAKPINVGLQRPTIAGRQVRLKASSLQLRGMYADLPGAPRGPIRRSSGWASFTAYTR